MVKTGQFTTKCKGDSHSSKMANITLAGLHLERYARPYQRSQQVAQLSLKNPRDTLHHDKQHNFNTVT